MYRLLLQTEELIPEDLREQGEELLETAKANPVLLWTLVGVGVITALIFVFGVLRSAFKAAFIGALLSAGAWYWYFNIR
jgi:hypothetical protein